MLMLKKGDVEMLMLEKIGEIKITQGEEFKEAVLKALSDMGAKYCTVSYYVDGCTIKIYDENKEN